jgi:thiamine kinase-like enzyme
MDPTLRTLAGSRTAPAYPAYVAAVVVDLEKRSGRVLHPGPHSSLARGMNQLRERFATLRPVELVATHGDPNRKNFIVATDAYLVDWDDLTLSDPMRDIGPLLWWYVPPNEWKDLLVEIGHDDEAGIRDRLYWWVAAESLDVALSLLEGGSGGAGAADFLDDFVAAINGQGNPHARI